jgi:hypothetical protein
MLAGFLLLVSFNVQEPISPKTIAEIKRATALIEISQKGKPVGSGSGFLVHIDADGAVVVTNHHVVRPSLQYIVVEEKLSPRIDRDPLRNLRPPSARDPFRNMRPNPALERLREMQRIGDRDPFGRRRESEPEFRLRVVNTKLNDVELSVVFDSGSKDERAVKAELLVADETRDLAALRIDGKDFPKPIDLAAAPQVFETLPVYVFGFPLGASLSIAKGRPAITVGTATVSSLRTDADGELAQVQVDGNLNQGNSGGPIVDSQGRLVGVAKAIARDSQGIGFAVPGDELRRMIAGRSGDCLATLKRDGDNVNLELSVEIIDPLAKVTAAKVLCLPASLAGGARPALATLEDVSGVQTVALKLDRPRATGRLPFDRTEEKEVLVQPIVEIGGKPIAAKVVRKTLIPLPAVASTSPGSTRESMPKEGTKTDNVDPNEALRNELEKTKKRLDEMQMRLAEKRRDAAKDQMKKTEGATDIVGGGRGPLFRDEAPAGGMLVGVELGLREYFGKEAIGAVRPIYRTSGGEKKGEPRGSDFAKSVVLKAKDGFAVGGATLRGGGNILNGVRLNFMRVNGDRLDPADAYPSDWAGDDGSGILSEFNGNSSPIIGLVGKSDDKHCTGLGLLFKDGKIAATRKATPKAPASGLGSMIPHRPATIDAALEIAGGGAADLLFRDEAPGGSLLIGLEIGLRSFLGNDMVGAVRPVFLTPNGERRGAAHGEDFNRKVVVKAKDGYAVGGIIIKSGSAVDGFQVRFMRVRAGRLDPIDAYDSDWIGSRTGDRETRVSSTGAHVVGIFGRTDDRFCTGLGLVTKR